MKRFLPVVLSLGLLLGNTPVLRAEAPPTQPAPELFQTPRSFQGRSDQDIPFGERVRRRLPHRFQRLLGVHQVDDKRLRDQFDQTVEVLIRLQQEEIQVDAEFQREIKRRRTQRRMPLGPRDLRDQEPSHIPAVEILRNPLS